MNATLTSVRSSKMVAGGVLVVGLFAGQASAAQAASEATANLGARQVQLVSAAPTVITPGGGSGPVSIPADYNDSKDAKPRSLHDYCSGFLISNYWGRNPKVDLRGTCARHDMCYEKHTAGKKACDDRFYEDMMTTCSYYFQGKPDGMRECSGMAHNRAAAVRHFGDY